MHNRLCRWVGLTVAHCRTTHAYELHDLVLSEPALVLWLSDAPTFRVAYGGVRWQLQPREGLFDYYPAGSYDLVQRDDGPAQALKVTILPRWRRSLGLDEGDSGEDLWPRFQFRDPRLRKLVAELNAQRELDGVDFNPAYAEYLKHATLACWAERQSQFREHVEGRQLPLATRRLIADYVDLTLGDDLDVAHLARMTGYSPTQFIRRFKATFEMPPHRYVIERRVERAKELLRSSGNTLTQIAQELGFATHAHFTTTFKRFTGITPSDFRRS